MTTFDVILCNDNYNGALAVDSRFVIADEKILSDSRTHTVDLIDEGHAWRHDSKKLTRVIMDIFYERTGPLS